MIDTAYDYLKSRILDGIIRPGAFVDLDAAAKHLGTSKQPLRFAASRLQSEALLEVIPQVGCRVPNVTADQVYDFIAIFAAIEGRMAEFAAVRATATDVKELKRISARIGALWGRKTVVSLEVVAPQFRRLNREFHAALHACAKADGARPIADMMMDRYDFYIAGSLHEVLYDTRVDAAVEEHEAVLSAIAQHDARLARSTMENHVMHSIDRVIESMRRDPARPHAR